MTKDELERRAREYLAKLDATTRLILYALDDRHLIASLAAFAAAVLAERDQIIANLRRDLADPPPDVQELVIQKLNLVSGDVLKRAEQAEARVAKLEAALRACYDHLDGCSHGYPDSLWEQVEEALQAAPGAPGGKPSERSKPE